MQLNYKSAGSKNFPLGQKNVVFVLKCLLKWGDGKSATACLQN